MRVPLGPLADLTLRGRLVLPFATLVAAAGVWWRYPVLVGIGVVLVVVVVAELVSVRRAVHLAVRREVHPRVVVRHEECRGTLHLTGRRRIGLARVEAADLVDGALVPVRLVDDREAKETRVDYDVATTRRGLVEVGPVQLRRVGLTGMAARSERTGDVVHVRVLPRRIPLAGMAPGHRRAVNATGNSLEFGGTDLVGLHEYTVGDDLRRLHWPTSARTGTLMVREDADPSEPHVFVLLDDRASSHPTEESFEDSVELVDALCRAAVEAGSPVRFRTATGSEEVDVPAVRPGEASVDAQALEWLLAEIQTSPDPQLADLGTRDLDVFIAVSGSSCDIDEVALAAGSALTPSVLLLDPAPSVAVESRASLLLLRGRTSLDLASTWDRAVAR